ncbi:hypothetical protein FRC09_000419 [Ceratobasidium sp. 395]|nr:hypothetical protein FRC09_000419 [Ceratobasidium sp. 395]
MSFAATRLNTGLAQGAKFIQSSRINSSVLPRQFPVHAKSHGSSRYYSRSHAHTTIPTPAGPKKPRRAIAAAVAVSLASASYVAGSLYPPTTLQLIAPAPAPPAPALGTEEAAIYTAALEEKIQNLEIVKEFRKREGKFRFPRFITLIRPNVRITGWYESRPYKDYPEERRRHALVSGSLRGPGKIALPPVVFAKEDESETLVIVHVGRSLCGHDGIVHGGLLATLLDESLARTALLNLPAKVGVTANLSINYRAPARADQFISIRTRLEKLEGRKATVTGEVRSVESDEVLTTANALFVQPKYAHMLNAGGAIEKLLGAQDNPKFATVGPEGGKQKVKVPQEAAV